MVTNGNAGQCNDVGKEVSPDGLRSGPATSLGKYEDQGEDPVLANTLQGKRFQLEWYNDSISLTCSVTVCWFSGHLVE